jgi:BirA family transcriptional regulator, biotin operon repressor / biotin---[acetyl-CoA-carboxylase] ligase
LNSDDLREGLKTKVIGKRIFAYGELDSTNQTVWQLGEQGLPEGTCAFAEHQKKGKGRLGRSWSSPSGENILLSVLLRPSVEPAAVPRITLAAALAVIRAIEEETGLRASVKWPNDVLLKGKKLCGILTEMSAEADRVHFVVLGIGLNANSHASDLPAGSTSLSEALGKKIDRLSLAQELLRQLEKYYDKVRKGKAGEICEEWEALSETTGKQVTAKLLNRTVHGTATGIDPDGALWIRHDNGIQERILSGDIQHMRKKESAR